MLRLILAVSMVLGFSIGGVAQPVVPFEIQEYSLDSKILNEERVYSVYLHKDCEIGGRKAPCPVLYMFDGGRHTHYAGGMLEQMARMGDVPRMVLIAIATQTHRNRDLTPTISTYDPKNESLYDYSTNGGGDAFLDFVEKELMPEVEARYEPLPYRVLAGHSRGGLLALFSFVSRPHLFQAHIVIEPSLWWNDLEVLKLGEAYLQEAKDVRNKVFISVVDSASKGEHSESEMEIDSGRFALALRSNTSLHLRSTLHKLAGEDHDSVSFLSLYHGLKFVFDGYKDPPNTVRDRGLEEVKAYYQDYLAEHGIHLQPPSRVIVDLARASAQQGRSEEELVYLNHYLANNPRYSNPYYLLGDFYRRNGQKDLAIQHYEKGLELELEAKALVDPILEALRESDR